MGRSRALPRSGGVLQEGRTRVAEAKPILKPGLGFGRIYPVGAWSLSSSPGWRQGPAHNLDPSHGPGPAHKLDSPHVLGPAHRLRPAHNLQDSLNPGPAHSVGSSHSFGPAHSLDLPTVSTPPSVSAPPTALA
jgi:hypothetical protein